MGKGINDTLIAKVASCLRKKGIEMEIIGHASSPFLNMCSTSDFFLGPILLHQEDGIFKAAILPESVGETSEGIEHLAMCVNRKFELDKPIYAKEFRTVNPEHIAKAAFEAATYFQNTKPLVKDLIGLIEHYDKESKTALEILRNLISEMTSK